MENVVKQALFSGGSGSANGLISERLGSLIILLMPVSKMDFFVCSSL
jgi:hypothetical protein